MKDYTVEVVETKIVYVEAENDDEAIMLAKTEAVGVEPDTIEGKIVRREDDEEEPVTVCGEHGCDGCILQYAFDIEACKRQAPRTEESDANRG